MKIFISYSTQDEKIVRELAKFIPKGVVDIWIDHTKMGGGAKLSKEIKKVLMMLIFISYFFLKIL